MLVLISDYTVYIAKCQVVSLHDMHPSNVDIVRNQELTQGVSSINFDASESGGIFRHRLTDMSST
jgi:hypothetical protein